MNKHTLQSTSARLADVDCWIFDLDNTIYPAACSLFEQIHDKMGEFIARELKVDRDEATRIQKMLFREHGTTLRGLMTVYGLEPEGFLDHVHRIDLSRIPPDPAFAGRWRRCRGASSFSPTRPCDTPRTSSVISESPSSST